MKKEGHEKGRFPRTVAVSARVRRGTESDLCAQCMSHRMDVLR